jgi:hypothetical protein
MNNEVFGLKEELDSSKSQIKGRTGHLSVERYQVWSLRRTFKEEK